MTGSHMKAISSWSVTCIWIPGIKLKNSAVENSNSPQRISTVCGIIWSI